jgi:hypothetical protein
MSKRSHYFFGLVPGILVSYWLLWNVIIPVHDLYFIPLLRRGDSLDFLYKNVTVYFNYSPDEKGHEPLLTYGFIAAIAGFWASK